jgi:acetylglutamate kinase
VATGINGLDGNLFLARPKDERLGFVGEITEVNPGLISSLQERDFVPVIAPLARGEDGQVYNVNADAAAGALAAALGAKKLIFLTDVEGLYRVFGKEDSLIARSSADGIRKLLASGNVSAGMLPKLQACVQAIEAGVERVHILDGRVQHAVLLEVFTPEGIGTTITKEPFV